MQEHYKIIESTVVIDKKRYITYGISCYNKIDILDMVYDISLNKNKVEHICKFLNTNEIPFVHFRDIIEDFTE